MNFFVKKYVVGLGVHLYLMDRLITWLVLKPAKLMSFGIT